MTTVLFVGLIIPDERALILQKMWTLNMKNLLLQSDWCLVLSRSVEQTSF
jgi:hypothetical protein